MEKKDFEKTFEKVAELNKQLREECCDYLRKVLKENGNSIDLQSEDEDYAIVCVTYDGGNHPEYAANPFSIIYGVKSFGDDDILLDIEDTDDYSIDNIRTLELYYLCLYISDHKEELKDAEYNDLSHE